MTIFEPVCPPKQLSGRSYVFYTKGLYIYLFIMTALATVVLKERKEEGIQQKNKCGDLTIKAREIMCLRLICLTNRICYK